MKNGGYYTGFWYRRKPHGEGEYQFSDSSKYIGDVLIFDIVSGKMVMQVERVYSMIQKVDIIKESFI